MKEKKCDDSAWNLEISIRRRPYYIANGGPRYLSNRQIHVHEDLGVPLFGDHIRALTTSFDSKLADVENPLVRQLGRYLR